MSDFFTWPDEWSSPSSIRFYLKSNSLTSTQAATGTRSVYGPLASLWMCEIASVPIDDDRLIRMMEAFIADVGGVSGLIRIGSPVRRRPYALTAAALAGAPWADGSNWQDNSEWYDGVLPSTVSVAEAASRGDRSILLQGFPASMSPALYRGDHIEIQPSGSPAMHGHLYSAAADAPSDADGKLRVRLSLPLRAGVAVGDQAVLENPKSLFRLLDDGQGIMEYTAPLIGRVGANLMEVLP
jgi:hypothetical protein